LNPKGKALNLATLLFGLLVASNLSGCRAQQPQVTSVTVTESNERTLQNWEKFVSPDGAFAIMFPQKPVDSQYWMDSPAGKLVIHSYKHIGTASYFLSYTDYPAPIDRPENKKTEALDHAREGGLRAVNGRLLSQSDISIKGHPGRLIVVDSPNGPDGSLIQNRVYLVGNRLYSMQVAIPKGAQVTDTAAEKFLDSFELSHDTKDNR
jgi:hypothetical protein